MTRAHAGLSHRKPHLRVGWSSRYIGLSATRKLTPTSLHLHLASVMSGFIYSERLPVEIPASKWEDGLEICQAGSNSAGEQSPGSWRSWVSHLRGFNSFVLLCQILQ